MRGPVFALTIWQPWAWAIAEGHKQIENRTWAPPRHILGRWMLIHAGANLDAQAVPTVRRLIRVPHLPRLIMRHVIGAVHVAAVYSEVQLEIPSLSAGQLESDHPGQGRWYAGPVAWFFDQVVAFPQPIPMRGQQGLFRVPDVVADQAREQYKLGTRRSAEDDGPGPQPNSPADVGYAGGSRG